jgi:crotonobetainyl-CoA:carnitine CoA-transferase CaiB-like acyl-CoA transferase
MGALFHRERTGEATIVDVSLLGVGLWSMGAALALSLQLGMPWAPPPLGSPTRNPLVGTYPTKDGQFLSLSCLQAARYWAEICALLDRPELATDERFAEAAALSEHAQDAADEVRAAVAERTADEWRARLEGFSGQWTVVQDTLQAVEDPQTIANGLVANCETATGTPFQLAAAPVQYDEQPAQPRRAPEFNEHGEEILTELGIDWDTIVDLKVKGVVA